MKDILDESDHNKKLQEQKINQLLWILKGILTQEVLLVLRLLKFGDLLDYDCLYTCVVVEVLILLLDGTENKIAPLDTMLNYTKN